jgi:hypothetical protein
MWHIRKGYEWGGVGYLVWEGIISLQEYGCSCCADYHSGHANRINYCLMFSYTTLASITMAIDH